jgi:hypothetical protein
MIVPFLMIRRSAESRVAESRDVIEGESIAMYLTGNRALP